MSWFQVICRGVCRITTHRSYARNLLFIVRQSTLDLQGLFLSSICDMTAFGANQHPRPSNQVMISYYTPTMRLSPLRAQVEERVARVPQGIVVSVAECFIRVPHWGLFLEVLNKSIMCWWIYIRDFSAYYDAAFSCPLRSNNRWFHECRMCFNRAAQTEYGENTLPPVFWLVFILPSYSSSTLGKLTIL